MVVQAVVLVAELVLEPAMTKTVVMMMVMCHHHHHGVLPSKKTGLRHTQRQK